MTQRPRHNIILLEIFILLGLLRYMGAGRQGDVVDDDNNNSNTAVTTNTVAGVVIGATITDDNTILSIHPVEEATAMSSVRTVLPECTLVMAPSSIPNAGWGVYTLTDRKKNEPLLKYYDNNQFSAAYGDVVLQVPDLQHPLGASKMLWEYLWDATETGGQFEGLATTVSFIPGVAMLANGDVQHYNVLPSLQPDMDDAEVSGRSTPLSPGTGAFTYYHNYTWYISTDMVAGDEILVNYGLNWFRERGLDPVLPPTKQRRTHRPSLQMLQQESYCLDNMRPGSSTIPHAGRGAFAKRNLQMGTVVAPVPVLPISQASLQMVKLHHDGHLVETHQLLTNYCYGHSQSSLRLCPYSDMVHLINHAPIRTKAAAAPTANVRLRWSSAYGPQYFAHSMERLQETSTQLLLELVATRDIREGEEILLDYGQEWSAAWSRHVQEWKLHTATGDKKDHADVSSHIMNRQHFNDVIRTINEQKVDPYPDNIFTSCYYKLTMEDIQAMQQQTKTPKVLLQWKPTQDILEPRNLRPCLVLDRKKKGNETENNYHSFYTVRLMNRPGTKDEERIPKNAAYIVTHLPRTAIRFSDKLYTTDQHLETAFRHCIGLEVFPEQCMDLGIRGSMDA